VDGEFIQRDGDTIHVLGWAEKNASLFAAWENGGKGGRPKKNPDETHGKPTGNPALTQREPIREEKSREEEKDTPPLRGAPRRKCPEDFAITSGMREWASAKAPGIDVDRETEAFRDHTFRNAIADWAGAWRNWMRRATPQRVVPTPPAVAVWKPDAPMTPEQREASERARKMALASIGRVQ
jgi:hypothetical protein